MPTPNSLTILSPYPSLWQPWICSITLSLKREELESLLIRVKEESEKVGLKLNIQKTVADFMFWGSKITAHGDMITCSHEIKRRLLLGRNIMTNLEKQHIKNQRHYFANKGPSSQGYGFSSHHVWMWELDYKESWVPKNWCFWTVVLKTLVSPLDGREIQTVHPKDQSWVFIRRTNVEAETPNTLSTWCKELTHLKRSWCWERLKMRREGDDRGWDGWMASPSQWTWVWVNSGSWWWTGRPGMLWSMGSQKVGHDWVTELKWALSQLFLYAKLSFLNTHSTFFSFMYLLLHSSKCFLYGRYLIDIEIAKRMNWHVIYNEEVWQGCLFNLYTEHIMRNSRLDELQAGIKIGGRNINILRYAGDTTLMAESKEKLKNLLMTVREESLRPNIKKKKT